MYSLSTLLFSLNWPAWGLCILGRCLYVHQESVFRVLICIYVILLLSACLGLIIVLSVYLTPARWPKTNSLRNHDSNAPSFVINGTKLMELENVDITKNSVFPDELQIIVSFAKIENTWESIYSIYSPLMEISCSTFSGMTLILIKQSLWKIWMSGAFLKPEK